MIETFAILIFVSLVSASFSYFLDFCFEHGNIFGFWGEFLERHLESWWSKPLGACIVCSGFWQGLVICPIILDYFGQNLSFLNIAICVMLSNLIIRKLI